MAKQSSDWTLVTYATFEIQSLDDLDQLLAMDESNTPQAHNPWIRAAPVDLLSTSKTTDLAADSPLLLKLFYQHFFPMKPYFQWLNYDPSLTPTKSFMNREFCLTLLDGTYIRFNSYKTMDEFKQELARLCPAKIDLGAIYNIRPKDKSMVHPAAFIPVAKELVFDIDMTDYDEIRTCCSGGDVCTRCWEFMTVAMKIIDAVLRDDFGFKHLLWVYSGRRGIHCWIGDERARVMNNEQRKAIVSYIEVIKGGAQQGRKVKLPNLLHPSLSRAYEVIGQHFPSIMFESQDILTESVNWEKVLAIIPDDAIQASLRSEWEKTPTRGAAMRWTDLKDAIGNAIADSPKKKQLLEHIPRDIMFQYTYPRLDEKVSTNINHLLKSPFCVHPITGRVCVPIPIESCEDFDPASPPTIPSLARELDVYDAQHPPSDQGPKLQAWQKTSLRGYVEHFEKFVKGIHKDVKEKRKREMPTQSLEF
ncbi:hypothetical protein BGZ94_007313 [Podila epigama]|nr:hypothetical protein BGZ94_007313 [Podila epigama]